MSDVEDYAYSPYNDFEDMLYDADPAPELADDLAEHALHSPVYQELVTGRDLQSYHSDWEYYSDDYMDDDPAILAKLPQEGTPPRHQAGPVRENNKPSRRGRKRKLAETDEIPPLDLAEGKLLVRCIKGVQWADRGPKDHPSYVEGKGERVALMRNWKEVFSITDNGWGKAYTDEEYDESWANDMSLADMGLRNLQGQSSLEQDEGQAVLDQGDEEDADEELEQGEDSDGEDWEEPAKDDIQQSQMERASPPSARDAFPEKPSGNTAETAPESNAIAPQPNNRLPSGEVSPAGYSEALVAERDPTLRQSKRAKTSARDDNSDQSSKLTPSTLAYEKTTKGTGNRKRKVSEEIETDGSGMSRSTASSRAKRVATAKGAEQSATTTRQTRHSKK